MSHKATVKLKINSRETLLQTLDALGLQYQVAYNTNGLKITSRYNVQANVDILLKQDAKNQNMQAIGFKKNEDDTYEAVGDFYEVSHCVSKDNEKLNKSSFKDVISKRYTYFKAVSQLTQAGYSIEQDVTSFKQEELVFTMNSYN